MTSKQWAETVLRSVAEIIDPMAWKAWEIDRDIETRRAVSLAKAKEIERALAKA